MGLVFAVRLPTAMAVRRSPAIAIMSAGARIYANLGRCSAVLVNYDCLSERFLSLGDATYSRREVWAYKKGTNS